MNDTLRFPPEVQSKPTAPPMVYVHQETVWEYKHFIRNLEEEKAPSEDELNTLGAEGWELAGVLHEPPVVHFYFKR